MYGQPLRIKINNKSGEAGQELGEQESAVIGVPDLRLLSGSSDEAAVNAAKSTLSAAIPVVGGIASDASEAVLQSAKLLRATAGTFGILAVLAMVLVPFFKIMICYLTMKLTAAIAGFAAGKEHAALISAQSSAMGYVLGMTGSAALMLLFSTCCFMKVASG